MAFMLFADFSLSSESSFVLEGKYFLDRPWKRVGEKRAGRLAEDVSIDGRGSFNEWRWDANGVCGFVGARVFAGCGIIGERR